MLPYGAPVVAVAIEAIRGDLPSALTKTGIAVVIAGVVIVNLPRAEALPRADVAEAGRGR